MKSKWQLRLENNFIWNVLKFRVEELGGSGPKCVANYSYKELIVLAKVFKLLYGSDNFTVK